MALSDDQEDVWVCPGREEFILFMALSAANHKQYLRGRESERERLSDKTIKEMN